MGYLSKMDYPLWDVICHVLEFYVDDEAANDLRWAGPWKIITGCRETPYTVEELRQKEIAAGTDEDPEWWDSFY